MNKFNVYLFQSKVASVEVTFDQHFWSEFLESYEIFTTKLIKSDLALIEMFEMDRKRSKIDQKGSNLIKKSI